MTDGLLAAAELGYLEARDAYDRLTIGAARGVAGSERADFAARAATRARATLNEIEFDASWPAEDRRAYDIMTGWLDALGTDEAASEAWTSGESWAVTAERGYAALSARISAAYARAQSEVDIDGVTVTRLDVLERLGVEEDARRRRRLFLALEPTWQTIDADGGVASPYLRMLPSSAERWAGGLSPVDRNAAALGMASTTVEPQLVAILETWRDAFPTAI